MVAVRAALEAGDLRLLLHDRDEEDEMILELIELARRQGIPCTATATSDLRRMGPSRPTVRVLGLTGRDRTSGSRRCWRDRARSSGSPMSDILRILVPR